MEDLDESILSADSEPLFILEEETESNGHSMEHIEYNSGPPGLTCMGTQMNQSVFIQPFLQEMDAMLKSCEDLNFLPMDSGIPAHYKETTLAEVTNCEGKEEKAIESFGEKNMYLDTHMDGVGAEERQVKGQHRDIGRREMNTGVSRQAEMPLTAAGHKLSDTMVAYEGQLLGMLAMLENCMEEAGMDFEPQDWDADTSQEYVHIQKKSHLSRGTTLVPIQQVRPGRAETQQVLSGPWTCQGTKESEPSDCSNTQGPDGYGTDVGQHNPALLCDSTGGYTMEQLEKQMALKGNDTALDPHFGLSSPPVPLCYPQHEMPTTGYMSTNENICSAGIVTANARDHVGSSDEDKENPHVVLSDPGSFKSDLGALWSRMEECIEKVQQLKKRRRELLAEALALRGESSREVAEGCDGEDTDDRTEGKVVELMTALKKEEEGRREERKMELQGLREERAEEERRIWKVNVERQAQQDEHRTLKKRLFRIARDCAQSQFALNAQRREVQLLKKEEEELQSVVHQLTAELTQLKTVHKQQMLELEEKLSAQSCGQTSNTQEELTQCRRNSCGDIQQYLQAGLKTLEDRFEPILVALLKRREAAAVAVVKAKEQAQELRAQLRPLKEENQELKLKRACLEEKLKLIHIQTREDVQHYKETVYHLEECTRELKTQLKLQKLKTKEMEETRDSLTKQLHLYKAAIGDHTAGGGKDET